MNKNKTVTFRLNTKQLAKVTNAAIERSVKEGRIVKLSEIIREAIEKY